MQYFFTKVLKQFFLSCLVLFVSSKAICQVSVSASQGVNSGSYTSVNAVFGAINSGIHKGTIVITVAGTTIEPNTPIPLYKSALPSSYTSILIKPQGNAVITCDTAFANARGLLEFVGADNVTINGDDPNTPNKQNLTIKVEPTAKDLVAAISLGSKGFSNNDGDSNIVIKNCNIIGNRTHQTDSKRSFGISFTNNMLVPTITNPSLTNSFAHSHSNIIIDSNNISKAYFGIYAAGNDTFPNSNIRIRGNNFGSIVPEDVIGQCAIYISNSCKIAGAESAIIEGNDITVGDGVSLGVQLHIAGLQIYNGNHGIVVNKNNIHDILHGPSASTAWGIFISGKDNTSINITNNFIRDIASGNNNASINGHFSTYGIYAYDDFKSLNITNNTVVLNTPNAGGGNVSNAVSACIQFPIGTATASKIINNILINNQPSTNAYCIITSDTANIYNAVVNNNSYYSTSGNVGWYKGAARFSLADWQLATNKDMASVYYQPSFVSSTDLHIIESTLSRIESAGMPVSITNISDDFDSQTRPGPIGSISGGAKNPDIGADEFDGIIEDVAAPMIMYAKVVKTCTNLDQTISNVQISDASGVPLTGTLVPRIYFKKNSGFWVSNAGIKNSGTQYDGLWSFTISSSMMGGVNANDIVSYFIVAQDIATSPNIGSMPVGATMTNVNTLGIEPPKIYSYLVGSSLGGTYTVGTGGNFATITDAVNAYKASCLTDNVIFSLISNTYVNEILPITIELHPDASATRTLTIKPAVGNNIDMGVDAANVFIIKGAAFVTIDGSNNASNTQNFKITNTKTAASNIIQIASLGNGKGSSHIIIKNMEIIAGDFSLANIKGIDLSGADNNYITINNCKIDNAYVGISALNTSSTNMMDSINISNNQIGTNLAHSIGFRGIELSAVNNFTISSNIIKNLYTDAFRFVTGIDISPKVTNGRLEKNTIQDIFNDYSSGWGSFGISLTSSNGVTEILIANNFISGITTGQPSATNGNANANGIRILGGTNIKIYHNTLSMNGAATGSNNGFSSCILLLANIPGLEIKNNILSNTQTFSGSSCNNYCIYVNVTGVSFTDIDYNDYYGVAASNSSFKIGYVNTTPKITLSDWANYSNGDAHSISVDPDFTSNNDLHITNGNTISLLESAAPIVGSITTDIDNDARPGPAGSTNGGAILGRADIGADEFDRKPNDCSVPLSITISNLTSGTVTINFAPPFIAPSNGYEYVVSTVTFPPTGPGTPISTTSFNLNGLLDNTTYYIYMRSACGSGNFSNWTSVVQFTTDCLPTSIPYFENFNSITPPNLPTCYTTQNLNTGGSTWFTSTAWIAGEQGYSIKYAPNVNSAANNWFYLPPFTLTAGKQYVLGFKYLMTGSATTFTEKMKIGYGLDNLASAMNTIIFDSANIKNQNKYYRPSITFSVPTSGTYFIGFNVYSAANQSSLYVDSISLTENILPINLYSFTGLQDGDVNKLEWTTLTETNNKGFELQKSENNDNNYVAIGFINSSSNNGNSSTQLKYSFIDKKLNNGVSYYRLKQVDFNGKTSFSSIVKLTNNINNNISIYPNPAKTFININVKGNAVNGIVEIIDIYGKPMLLKQMTKGNNVISIEHLSKGVYIVNTIINEKRETQKLVIN